MERKHLEKTAAHFHIEFDSETTEKTLLLKIKKFFKDNDLPFDYKCPNCDEDIPDVPFCPWCNVLFEEVFEYDEIPDAQLEKFNRQPKSAVPERNASGKVDWKDASAALTSIVDKHDLKIKVHKTYISYYIPVKEKLVKLCVLRKSKWLYSLDVCVQNFILDKNNEHKYRKLGENEIKRRNLGRTEGIYKTGKLEELKQAVESMIDLVKKGSYKIPEKCGRKKLSEEEQVQSRIRRKASQIKRRILDKQETEKTS